MMNQQIDGCNNTRRQVREDVDVNEYVNELKCDNDS